VFTGIITDLGEVAAREGGRYAIRCGYAAETIALGASIACNGCCLTVTGVTLEGPGSVFTVDVSNETVARTTLQAWVVGTLVNLERALKAGDEFGGHVVSGHVDGVARILSIEADGDSRRFRFEVPQELARFIAAKGSVALDGTSLTVNETDSRTFGVNLIPHTLTQTTWGRKTPGDLVNLEVDVFARYVARMMEFPK
jgi:riboflavin synthase